METWPDGLLNRLSSVQTSRSRLQAFHFIGEDRETVSITGTTTCSTCEYGVPLLGAKGPFDPAIKAIDGKVYIVEDAHKFYPQLYTDCFAAAPAASKVHLLQTTDNFVWGNLTSMKAQ